MPPPKPPAVDAVKMEPVLVLSHSYTYYAPREILAVRLFEPMAVTLGTAEQVQIEGEFRSCHVRLTDMVEDKLEGEDAAGEARIVLKSVPLSEIHAAIVLREGKMYYKHLGAAPSVVASRSEDSRIIQKAGIVLPLEFGQSVGLGATEDAFGQTMWWYYVRIYPLKYLRRQAAAAALAAAQNA